MKTRIFHTKFWTDGYTLTLTPSERLLFNFYFTNENIGMTGIYEMANQVVQLSTGLTKTQILAIQKKLSKDGKIFFYKDWIYIKNAEKYQSYTGEHNIKAKEREKELIPKDTLSILYSMGMGVVSELSESSDTPINKKEEIINNKLKTGDVKGGATEEDLQEISDKYKVPLNAVKLAKEEMDNWLSAKGKVYKDYRAGLRNWVLRDIKKIMEGSMGDPTKRGVDATSV